MNAIARLFGSIVTVTGLTLVGACAPKVLIFQAPVVSMTKLNAPEGAKLDEGKPINVSWCQGSDPIVENDDGSLEYGMIDQTIHAAHKKTRANFFTNARFYRQGDCVSMLANASGSGRSADESDRATGGKTKSKKPKKKTKKKSS